MQRHDRHGRRITSGRFKQTLGSQSGRGGANRGRMLINFDAGYTIHRSLRLWIVVRMYITPKHVAFKRLEKSGRCQTLVSLALSAQLGTTFVH